MPGTRHCWSLHDKKVVSAEIPVDGCLQHGFSFLRQVGKGALPTVYTGQPSRRKLLRERNNRTLSQGLVSEGGRVEAS